MRILIVGAGAVGGYFGGRLIEKGEDVTFLVREKRKKQLDENGLIIESIHGNVKLTPSTIQSGDLADPFDVVVLSTKSYHLHDAINNIKPYVNDQTMILPLLNGISHINTLEEAFDENNIIGGLCFIESTLDASGRIIQTSPIHELVFGEKNGESTERILKLQKVFSETKSDMRLSKDIFQELWHKYLFITTLSGVTSLYRSPIGPIRELEQGMKTINLVIHESATIMRALQAPVSKNIEEVLIDKINNMGYQMKSSLQRDMEKILMIEADHLFGYLLTIARRKGIDAPTLELIYSNLKIYEHTNKIA